MLNEIKLFFNNVRHFRKLLINEAVGDSAIVNAINNRVFIILIFNDFLCYSV